MIQNINDIEQLQRKIDYLISLQRQQFEPVRKISLFEWLDEYLKIYKSIRVCETRYYEIECVIRLHIKTNIQDKLLTDYLPIDIECALNKVINGRTRETTYQIYNEAFRLARKNKLIINNIMEDIRPIQHKRKTGKALTQSEQKKFIKQIKGHRYEKYFLFLLFSGCRKSEALHLDWSDIDFEKSILHIKGTKTNESDRYIPMSKQLIQLVLSIDRNGEKIFPYTPNQIAKSYQRLQKRYKLDFTIHSLRHTFATRCLECSISIKVVQKWLGHSRLDTTTKIYTQVLSKFEFEECKKLIF